ncbi:MAG: hypothetical protein QNJ97_21295 [Myxococcota bacterium]|nr:hypothetical protein [Myxococcota bacterium]
MIEAYVNTVANAASGEAIEMEQLAQAIGAPVVHTIPESGLLIYIINLVLRPGADDFRLLAQRCHKSGSPNVIIIGTIKGWDELEKWRPYFDTLNKISAAIFVNHPEQKKYLNEYGIDAIIKPINEQAYVGEERYRQNTVLYTGFLWEEKNLDIFVQTAQLLPDWEFTIHTGQAISQAGSLPANCKLSCGLLSGDQYMAYLASFEYIWIPRKPSTLIYPGRSGISAVASQRPAILTDVLANDIIPNDVAIKYPHQWAARDMADLIAARPRVSPERVVAFIETVSPANVWSVMQRELAMRGAIQVA